MSLVKTEIDRRCPDCGGTILLFHSDRMTHAHCENECGFGITSTSGAVIVSDFDSPEEAYDALWAPPGLKFIR